MTQSCRVCRTVQSVCTRRGAGQEGGRGGQRGRVVESRILCVLVCFDNGGRKSSPFAAAAATGRTAVLSGWRVFLLDVQMSEPSSFLFFFGLSSLFTFQLTSKEVLSSATLRTSHALVTGASPPIRAFVSIAHRVQHCHSSYFYALPLHRISPSVQD